MRKILFALIGCFAVFCAHAAQVVNVDYVHKLIAQKWDISVPIKTNNIMAVANMKYLLTAVDVANEILNGEKTTDYGNTEFATTQVADTVATIQAVDTLVKQNKIEYKFFMDIDLSKYDDNDLGFATVTEFGFDISAAGTFYIDWGDGTTETIKKADTNPVTYSHDYGTATGVFRVGIGGRATDYSDDTYTSVLNFFVTLGIHSDSFQAITNIDGSLGAIFGTLADGSQPSFNNMFSYTHGLKKIPDNLFKGIHGDLVDGMFQSTFSYCNGLTGPSARIDGLYLYEIWPDATEEQIGEMYLESSGLSDYACIPYVWGGGGEECDSSSSTPSVPEDAVYDFYLTTTSDTDAFAMKISAAGEFYIDWGDGKTEWITKSDTTNMTFGHRYASNGAYNIKLGGQATAYNTDTFTAAISFNSSAYKIASIDGSLGAIFGTLSSGTQKQPRFYETFSGASNMKAIPENLFAGISGAPASYMFYETFSGCSGLTSIPSDLFAGISGAPASNMFSSTFSSCSGLTSIPSDLFAGISGAPASSMFYNTFSGCRGLTSIPDGLFAGISGAPANGMFGSTFENCSGLTSIPDGLFAGISGAPANGMFGSTFEGCSGLTGAIPDGLFGNLSGAPATSMFSDTFSGCSGLTGAIPSDLFAGISGAPAEFMFWGTFSGCSGLTSIPENLFGNISGRSQSYMFNDTFYNCTSLTGPSARINGQYLYEIWPSATSYAVGNMYYNATGLDDYRCIPTVWGGAGEDCSAPTPEFTLTTTDDTDSFSFSISAAGEFVVDWGDGTVETITKPDTTNTTYSHNYSTAGAYTIGLSGQATAYNTDEETSAIGFVDILNGEFESTWQIASIDGSLGAIFGTLSSGTNKQPRFFGTFSYATNMTGSIPSDLFAGISGAPAHYMFAYTFSGCSGLTGAIPDGLFAGISGAPASSMFDNTFADCSGLTGAIPSDLFAGISGAPASFMFSSTFSSCSGLTSIPSDLFAGISGAPASSMFAYTFYGCTGLTGAIPSDLFAGISGAPASDMFNGTFYGCTGLTGAIPSDLFAGISGTPASYMFSYTFYGCSGLTGAIPDGLFGNLTGAPAYMMFHRTFKGCSKLTSIPENLFGNISGTAQNYMFSQTFNNCTSLTGPSARINGQYLYEIWPSATSDQVANMYSGATKLEDYRCIPTVWGGAGEYCSEFKLTTTSTNSFSFSISAAGKFYVDWGDGKRQTITKPDTTNTTYSHNYTTAGAYTIVLSGQATAYNTSTETAAISFYVNSSQTKIASIDGSLGAIFGTLSSDTNNQPRFYQTFYNATNMTGSIPSDLFAGISGAPASFMFYQTFYKCTSLTGPSARINGQYLYEIWPDATSSQVGDMYLNATGLEDYRCIPTVWGGAGEYCSEFKLTTTSTNSFSFSISAAGKFYVDWGDGKRQTITKPDTTNTTYSHNYSTAGAYTIGLSGLATAYNTSTETAAISFYVNSSQTKIASIDGSLGAIFGTLSSDTNNQPRFYQTFYNATNMTGSIPSDLFAGISGAPAWNMFRGTFYGCSGLTSIPSDLFAGISGALAGYMFYNTFRDCGGLTSIPDGLFAGISGAPAEFMFYSTFRGCSGLTSIPDGLFAGISGNPATGMFNSTFRGCSGLTSIPENLFAGISGAPAHSMFYNTFSGCSKLTSIPENLFGNISGTAQNYMFSQTFNNCTSLTGPSARINGQYLYEIWPDATYNQVGDMYYNATKLSDYSNIPTVWK